LTCAVGGGNAGAVDEVDQGQPGIGAVKKSIPLMQERSLAKIIADPEIHAEYARLYENHLRNIDVIREEGSCKGRVIFFDLLWNQESILSEIEVYSSVRSSILFFIAIHQFNLNRPT
jgi:hypothetical protein